MWLCPICHSLWSLYHLEGVMRPPMQGQLGSVDPLAMARAAASCHPFGFFNDVASEKGNKLKLEGHVPLG